MIVQSINTQDTLIGELKNRGFQRRKIPRFIKDLGYCFLMDPSLAISDVNNRLQLLGWEDVELDGPTLRLVKDFFERIP